MTLENTPFQKRHLDEENKQQDTFTVRMNAEERAELEELKKDLNINSDSKALKMGATIGRNVLHSVFSAKLLRYLFKKDRQKLTDFKDF